MADLTHHLERSVVIRAKPETVFQFFTDSQRWAAGGARVRRLMPSREGKFIYVTPTVLRQSARFWR